MKQYRPNPASARIIFIIILFSGMLLSLTAAPAQAASGQASPPRQDTPPDEDRDFSSVVLRLEDMPAGFEDLQATQRDAMIEALSQMARSFGAKTQMNTENASGYWNGEALDPEFVVFLLVYPLTEAEQRSFDVSLSQPDQYQRAMTQMFGASSDAGLLEGVEGIGETAIGFSVGVSTAGQVLRMEFISARRADVIEEVLVAYLEGHDPQADVRQMARILDDRLIEVVGIAPAITLPTPPQAMPGDSVAFTANVTGPGPMEYLWDFGDGATSTEQNPSHRYKATGLYTVSLTVSNPSGKDSATYPLEVTGYRDTAPLAPELTTHIPTPLDISTDPAVVGTNLLLAAIVMILLTIACEFANRTLEENEAILQRLFRPLRWLGRKLSGRGAAGQPASKASTVLSFLLLLLLILIYGITFSLLEPGWNLLSTPGLWLFLCLTIGGGIVGLADDVIQWITARKWHAPTAVRLRPANLLVALASTGMSRLFTVVPGFMFGSPQAIDIDQNSLEGRRQTRLIVTGAFTALLVGLILWSATILTNLLQRGDLSEGIAIAIGGVESLCLSIFALAVQNGFAQMLALPDSYGRLLQKRNRWIWLLLLLAITFLFYHTLINPKGNLASAWASTNVLVFTITAGAGMILSLLVWLAFHLFNPRRTSATPPVEAYAAVPKVETTMIIHAGSASTGLADSEEVEIESFPAELIPAEPPVPEETGLDTLQAAITPVEPPLAFAAGLETFQPETEATDVAEPDEMKEEAQPQVSPTLQASLPAAAQTAVHKMTLPASLPGLSGNAKACPSCGKSIMVEARYCPFCSTRIDIPTPNTPATVKDLTMEPSPTRTCPHCSKTIPQQASFCQFCGAMLKTPQAVQATQTGLRRATIPTADQTPAGIYPSQPAPKRNSWLIPVLAGSLLLFLCCIAVIGIGWWQRERIPLVSGLLNPPTATYTPRPTRTPRPTSTSRPTPAIPTERPAVTEIVIIAPTTAPISQPRLCLLPDGNIGDNSFNALAWSGLQSAASRYGVESIYIEPNGSAPSDYSQAIEQLIQKECDLIIGVGVLTSDAIRTAAMNYPQQKFQILDWSFDQSLNNVWAQVYASDQGSFLAGYLAAGVSRTGKVATFGGIDIPTVRTYMNGFAAGVSYYNAQHNTNVQVLGWDIFSQTGQFTGDFANFQQGVILSRQLINQGADILFPVAGATGLGAASEATTRSNVYVIGVDNDWVISYPEYTAVLLTSVEKRLDISIFQSVELLMGDRFAGGTHTGTLNAEITLSPFHNLDWLVPDTLRTELIQVRADIIAGKINTQQATTPPPASGELSVWMLEGTQDHILRWVQNYQAAHPGVTISSEIVAYSDVEARWLASLAAGSGPDVILISNSFWVADWARNGMAAPLDEFLTGESEYFLPPLRTNLTVDGRLYGIPYSTYGMVMYYNKLLLPNPPGTMDELAARVRDGMKISMSQASFFLFPFLTAFGGQLTDSDGRCIADQNDGFLQALKYLQELSRNGAIITTDWTAFSEAFKTGEAAMTINGPWMFAEYQTALGDNLGVAMIPQGTNTPAAISSGNYWIINPNSRKAQLAVDFALFLTSLESQADLDINLTPMRADLVYSAGDPKYIFIWAAATGYPEILVTENYYPAFDALLTAVLSNNADPAAALRDACSQMNSLNGK